MDRILPAKTRFLGGAMTTFLAGLVAGILLGIWFGTMFSRIPDAVQAIGLGIGAGIGIFALGAVVRGVGGFVDKVFGRIKERQAS